jgi:hypothetical protein
MGCTFVVLGGQEAQDGTTGILCTYWSKGMGLEFDECTGIGSGYQPLVGVIGLTESSQEGQETGWTFDGRDGLEERVLMNRSEEKNEKKDEF